MAENNIYEDRLIEISNDSILLKNYYFPLIGSKRVPFRKIEFITAEKPSLLKGKFRIWRTGNFVTWYPLDFARPTRDRIFIINRLGEMIRIGFTAENSDTVLRIFEQKGLIQRATA
jgi:hypothetical protein